MATYYNARQLTNRLRQRTISLQAIVSGQVAIERAVKQDRAQLIAEDVIETRYLARYTDLAALSAELVTDIEADNALLVLVQPLVKVGRPALFDRVRFAALEDGQSVLWGPENGPSTDVFDVFTDGDIVLIEGSKIHANNRGYTVDRQAIGAFPAGLIYNILQNPDLQIHTGTGAEREPNNWLTPGTWGGTATDSWQLGDTVFPPDLLEYRTIFHRIATLNTDRVYQLSTDMHIPLVPGVTYRVSYDYIQTAGTNGFSAFVGNFNNQGAANTAERLVAATGTRVFEDIVCVENPGEVLSFGFVPLGTGNSDCEIFDIGIQPKSGFTNSELVLTETADTEVPDDANLAVRLKER